MDYTMDVANMKGKKGIPALSAIINYGRNLHDCSSFESFLLYYLCYIQARLYIAMQNM